MTPERQQWVIALTGKQLGDYILDSYLGGGGFGMVFAAHHATTGAEVAVKVLDPSGTSSASTVADFDNEGVLLEKLLKRSHVINWHETSTAPVPVTVGFGATAATVQLIFKYHVIARASGVLDEITSDPSLRNEMDWLERLSHWRGTILGIHQMHLSTVAHRDLKAENCLLMAGLKNSVEVRLTDLGRSKDFSTPPRYVTEEYLQGRGDKRHAAPECLLLLAGSTEADFRRADLYGIGSVLTELATGQSMTALALNWQHVVQQAMLDFRAGIHIDPAVLRPRYNRAVEEASRHAPKVIQKDIADLLAQLCSPVPADRLPKAFGKRPVRTDGLQWLLRRADITHRRLEAHIKHSHTNRKKITG